MQHLAECRLLPHLITARREAGIPDGPSCNQEHGAAAVAAAAAAVAAAAGGGGGAAAAAALAGQRLTKRLRPLRFARLRN